MSTAAARAARPCARRESCLRSRFFICSRCLPPCCSRSSSARLRPWSGRRREGESMDDDRQKLNGIVLTEAQKKSRRQRSIAIALALGVLVILFFAVTLVKGPAVLNRPI